MRIKKVGRAKRGSAIIMAVVIMMMLLILGLAVMTVSLGTLRVNVADASNNDAYYGAESAVKSAIEQVKYEVASYYTQMFTASSSDDYTELFDNFSSNIAFNAQNNFKGPEFNGIDTETTITSTFDESTETCEFLITCTATTADNADYVVSGRVYVKRVDLSVDAGNWLEIDGVALKAGGTFNNTNGFAINNGNAIIGNFINTNGTPYWQGYTGNPVIVNPNIGETINDCVTFSGVSYSNPTMSSPDYYITTNNYTLASSAINTTKAVKIASASGISFTVSDAGPAIYPGSVIYSRGNLNLTAKVNSPGITCYVDGNFTSSGATKYATVYCAGNATISSSFYGTIYCKGKVTISGNVHASVYCNGDFVMPNGSFEGLVICGGNGNVTASGGINASFYAAGDISISGGLQGNNHVAYAGGNLSLNGGGGTNAVLFAGGDIYLNSGPTVYGAVIAKGNVTQTSWFTINYSPTAVQAIKDNPINEFFFSASSTTEELNVDVIMEEEIIPVG